MASAALRNSVFSLAAAGFLMGCVEGAGPASETGGQTTAAPAALRAGSAKEVEAPEIYQATDSALWDGRPSLGGVWVAASDVTDPERVVIRNPTTGQSVTGALFRRERDNPGPPLQVSSDAAEALGMLAGQPTTLQVTALRKPAKAAAEKDVPADTAAGAAAAPAEGGASATDAAAAETAALATAALAATGAAAATGETAGEAAADAADGSAAAEAPKPKTWKERRAEAKARREAEKAEKAAAAAAAAAAAGTADGTAAASSAATGTVAVAPVETAPLDARSSEVTAAADTAAGTGAASAPEPQKKTRRQIRDEQEAAKAAAAAAATAEGPAAAPASGRSIQIASFQKEENAMRAVEALAKAGITAQALSSGKDGKTVWGVVATGDEALLAAIKDAGFADAYFLN
jgi:hypothetical protein